MKRLSLILACLIATAYAQNYYPVTAVSCITDASGALMTNGTLTVMSTDANDHFLPFRAGGAFQSIVTPVTRGIAAGSLTASLQLANPALTSPLNIRYRFTIQDNVTKKLTVYPLINLVANDVLSGGLFTQYNLCTANLLPNVPAFVAGTSPLLSVGDVTMTGKLGIGISPSFPLHVKANSAGDPNVLVESGSAASPVTEYRDAAGTPNRWHVGSGGSSATDGTFIIYDKRQGLYRLAITAGGAIGINTLTPISALSNFSTGVSILDQSGIGSNALSFVWAESGIGYSATILNQGTGNHNGLLVKTTTDINNKIITANFGVLGGGFDIWYVTGFGMAKDARGHKHIRNIGTGTIAANGDGNVAFTWITAFADASYTATCTTTESTGNLYVSAIMSQTASGLQINVHNKDGASSHSGTIGCTADHDPS